jgi:hypothetical protein
MKCFKCKGYLTEETPCKCGLTFKEWIAGIVEGMKELTNYREEKINQ